MQVAVLLMYQGIADQAQTTARPPREPQQHIVLRCQKVADLDETTAPI